MDSRRTLKRRPQRRPILSIPLKNYQLRLRLKRAAKHTGKPLATWAREALDQLTLAHEFDSLPTKKRK